MQKEKLFKFNTPEFSDYNLEVVSFSGYEEMGELYSYEVDLISTNSEIDLDEMLQTDVSLQILHKNNKEDIYIHGILASFEVSDKINDYIHYKAHLVPKLWRLCMSPFSQIFLNKNITDIIEDVLKQGNLTSSDYEFSLQESYDKKEYVCQYNETRYDFIKRWMQREGIYFYFQDSEDGCKLLITDNKSRHQEFPNDDKMPYKQASGLQSFQEQAISNLIYRSNTNPKSVRMKNFYYEKPSVNLDFTSNSSEQEYDEAYMYGNNIHTQSELKKYTQINQQRYECGKKELLCSSNIIYIKPGYLYKLKDYFKAELNTTYLDTKVESTGSQRGFMSAGFTQDSNEASYYTNTFSMISSQTQYRMNADAPWPKVSGMISATIDSQGSGETAQIDEQGRYKVKMPFDLSGRGDMKASAYIRMSQSSAGEKQGIHFPLHKGTEVLISFKGADPDQPIIVGAVPNINSPSPVNDKNLEKSIIHTHGGNTIEMNDTPGDSYIKFSVKDDACGMKMSTSRSDTSSTTKHSGTENNPSDMSSTTKHSGTENNPSDMSSTTKHSGTENNPLDAISVWANYQYNHTECYYENVVDGDRRVVTNGESTNLIGGTNTAITGGISSSFVLGLSSSIVVGVSNSIKASGDLNIFLGAQRQLSLGWGIKYSSEGFKDISPSHTSLTGSTTKVTEENNEVTEENNEVTESEIVVASTSTETVGSKTICSGDTNINSADTNINSADTNINSGSLNINSADTNINSGSLNIDVADANIGAGLINFSAIFTVID